MGNGLGTDFNGDDAALKLSRNVALQAFYEGPEVIEPHGSPGELFLQVIHQLRGSHTNLLERIAVAHRHGLILRRLTVDGDSERRPRLILAAIATPDGPAVV